MIALGVILTLLGWLLGISVFYVLGVILLVVGLVLWFAPGADTRRRWY